MASRSSDGRRYYFGLIRGTKHRFYDPESPIIVPESEPIFRDGFARDSLLQRGVYSEPDFRGRDVARPGTIWPVTSPIEQVADRGETVPAAPTGMGIRESVE
jgi:hypothetical protein